MDNVTQVIPAGTWQAQHAPGPLASDGWRDVPLVGWAVISADGEQRVVGLMLDDDNARHVVLVDEAARRLRRLPARPARRA
ncbi:MAG: hypothetical protein WKG07_40580 [Hymenobacter sp.]